MPDLSGSEKERLIQKHLRDPKGRNMLTSSLVRPTESLLCELAVAARFTSQAGRIVDYLSVLDRLDSAMGQDEPRAAFDGLGEVVKVGGVPLTFDNWRGMLRLRLEYIVKRSPDVMDLVLVAGVMQS